MSFRGSLYPYQEETVNRIISRKKLLVAFGCGTGKTVMAIAAAERLLESGAVTQVLILCPASLKFQWRDKIQDFTDRPAVVIDGDKTKRTTQMTLHINMPYIILSYDSVIYDYELMGLLKHEFTICDEVTAIKSFKAQRSKRVKKLFRTPYRLGLTATPIENKPEELYSIMQWVDDTVLGRYDLFEKAYIDRNRRGWVESYKNLTVLRTRMGDAMSRKTRHDPDVRSFLPDVDHDLWLVDMDAKTLLVYRQIASDMLEEIKKLNPFDEINLNAIYNGVDESTPPGKLMAMYMCAEMLMDHPDLIIWSGQEYEKDSPLGSYYAYSLWQSGLLDNVTVSPKLDRLIDELHILLADPESKIIIISKYKYMLNIIYDVILGVLGEKAVKFTGDMSATQKNLAVSLFNQPDRRILLASYAGGYGLDLYMADILINYDLPWSAGMQDQINSRHVRASSEFSKVYVRDLIMADSVEERKGRILERKKLIANLAVDGMESPDNAGGTVLMTDDFLKNHLLSVLTSGSLHGRIVSGGR